MVEVYERAFDWNEWFVIITLIGLSFVIWKIPPLFSVMERIAHFVYGIYIAMFFDHTISIKPWDFYDVNDSSAYQIIDFISYVMYGPISYLFIYIYVKLNIKGMKTIVYILIWTAFSLLLEWFSVKIGVFHFDKGYKMVFSPAVYLSVQTGQVIYYHLLKRHLNQSC